MAPYFLNKHAEMCEKFDVKTILFAILILLAKRSQTRILALHIMKMKQQFTFSQIVGMYMVRHQGSKI